MRTLIFIPTYNEAENIQTLFDRIQRTHVDADFLLLDDNSPDGTGGIIDRLAAENPRVHTIHRAGKLGVGSAHRDGIRWAYQHGYQLLLTMDSDFTHSPERIPGFLSNAADADVVVGSRYLSRGSLEGWNPFRRLLTHLGHFLTRMLLRMPHDATGAFRVYRLDRIPAGLFDIVYSRSYSFFFESLYILWLNEYRIKELPLNLPARTYGHSKMRARDALYSFGLLIYLYAKTLIHRGSLIYAEPFVSDQSSSRTRAEAEWDQYWLLKKEPGGLLFDLVAAFYRKFIIKRILNYFTSKHFSPRTRILHAGCGSGEVDTDLIQRFTISALDISIPALSIYRKYHGNAPELLHGSIFRIPAGPDAYEGIYNLGVMEHFTEEEITRILDEFHRVLKPHGKIILFWPPVFGLSVRFLAALRWLLTKTLGREIKLHPDELTHIRSRRQARKYLEQSGFCLEEFYFGMRDMFTHAVIVGRKTALFVERPNEVSSVRHVKYRAR